MSTALITTQTPPTTKRRKLPPLVQELANKRLALHLPAQSYVALGQYLAAISDVEAQPLPTLDNGDSLTEHLMVTSATELVAHQRGFGWVQPINRLTLTRTKALLLLGVLWGSEVVEANHYLMELRNRLHQTLC